MSHRQHQPIEGFGTPAPISRVRFVGMLNRQIELSIPVVCETQHVEVPGVPAGLHRLFRPLDNLRRGDNRAWANPPGSRQTVLPTRRITDPIRPRFAELLVTGMVGHHQ